MDARTGTQPATPAQIKFVQDLLHSRVVHPDAAARLRATLAAGNLMKGAASKAIDWMKAQPKRQPEVIVEPFVHPISRDEIERIASQMNTDDAAMWRMEQDGDREDAKRAAATQPDEQPVTEIGIYELAGKIYKVKRSKADRLYAMVLTYDVGTAERLTAAGSTIKAEYTYAAGSIYNLRACHRITEERAEQLSIVFNSCIVCGRRLKAAKSVARGIGPVCINKI